MKLCSRPLIDIAGRIGYLIELQLVNYKLLYATVG